MVKKNSPLRVVAFFSRIVRGVDANPCSLVDSNGCFQPVGSVAETRQRIVRVGVVEAVHVGGVRCMARRAAAVASGKREAKWRVERFRPGTGDVKVSRNLVDEGVGSLVPKCLWSLERATLVQSCEMHNGVHKA